MGEYYGDFTKLEGGWHYGCNDCGNEIWTGGGEPRWCGVCQANIWDDNLKEYRRLRAEAHQFKSQEVGNVG